MSKKKDTPMKAAGITAIIGEIFWLAFDLTYGIILGCFMLGIGLLLWAMGYRGKGKK